MNNTQDEFADCYRSPEQVKAELLAIEQRLAQREHITGDAEYIRHILIIRHKNSVLVEDELVQDWLQELASYDDYMRHGAYDVST